MVNALTRHTGFTLGPIVLETLIKHYFERVAKETESEETTKLRKEELLYDEAFNIIKVRFLSLHGHGRFARCAWDPHCGKPCGAGGPPTHVVCGGGSDIPVSRRRDTTTAASCYHEALSLLPPLSEKVLHV